MKKGQVTFFIIIGMIILFAFFLVYILGQKMQPSISEGEISLQKTRLMGEPIKIYVESCIRDSVKEVVPLFLAQGGRVYSDQEGSIIPCNAETCTNPGSINYDEYDVSYLLTSNIVGDDVGNKLLPAPDYPCNATDCEFIYDFDRPCNYDSSQTCPLP